jgi:hypothetical protein
MLERINVYFIAKNPPLNSPNLTKLIYSGTYHKNVRIPKNLSSILVEIYRIYLKRSRSKLTSPQKTEWIKVLNHKVERTEGASA